MDKPLKVAIIGGGMGGLAAAWELSRQPDADKLFEITVFQRGWRLGGKGASGAPIDQKDHRIEEHGLHILMGFYDQVFAILEDCYAEASTDVTLPAFDDVLTARSTIWVADERRAGDWSFWQTAVPDLELKPYAGTISMVKHGLNQVGYWMDWLRRTIKQLNGHGGGFEPSSLVLGPQVSNLQSLSFEEQLKIAAVLNAICEEAFRESAPMLAPVDLTTLDAEAVARRYHLRKYLSLFYLATTFLAGLIKDRLVGDSPDFTKIDDKDFRMWLKDHGPNLVEWLWGKELSWNSAFVRAFYDLAFSMDRKIAAGVACNNLIHILFGWKEEVFYKMNGGMGDVVFAPLYVALKRRNVKFEYFHRAIDMDVDPNTMQVTRVTLERQVKGLAGYDPIVTNAKTGFPGWPNEPHYERMPEKYRADRVKQKRPPHDFETEFPSEYSDPDNLELELGKNFDVVVLAVSVGGLRGAMCSNLRKHNADFDRMVSRATTMPTQALQIWLKKELNSGVNSARWVEGQALAGYQTPYSSCTEMNQVIEHECWPDPAPRTVGYFCGSFAGAPDNKKRATELAGLNAAKWINGHLFRILPGVSRDGEFFRNELIDLERGWYVRANVDPSDQYVLSEVGTSHHRLAPGSSGFANLFLAGDWVKNGLDSGCVESAARGGVLAAKAILAGPSPSREHLASGGPRYVTTDGDWVIRPPGVVEDVTMRIFLVDTETENLKEYCELLLERPSGGVVTADPLFPGFVMLVFADIPRGYPPENPAEGDQAEKDMAIFLPVTLQVNGKRKGLAALVPYLYVDNPTGVITGREVYGFPKHMADFKLVHGKSYETWSQVRPTRGDHVKITTGLVAKVTIENEKVRAELSNGDEKDLAARDNILATLVKEVLSVAKMDLLEMKLGDVPLVFLKQFRDAVDPDKACLQEIVQAPMGLSPKMTLKVLTGKYRLELPEWDKPRIAEVLGIDARPDIQPLSFELKMGFRLPAGTILWKGR